MRSFAVLSLDSEDELGLRKGAREIMGRFEVDIVKNFRGYCC